MTILLSLFGAGIKLSGYGRYILGIARGEMRPNMATWTLWVFLSSMNSASYLLMSHDPYKSAVAMAGTTGCILTYVFALRRGSMQGLNRWDRVALSIGLAAGAAWWFLKSASSANLILQAGFIISMIPTYRGLLADHDTEKPAPWLLMSAAYAINLIVVVLRWDGNIIGLVYPGINMISHAGVGILAMTLAASPKIAKVPAVD